MWETVAQTVGTGGGAGVLAWIFYRLHRSAIQAEKRRADDWREACVAERARADLKDQQIGILLGRVRGNHGD